jgi:hypothetical protein
MQRGQYKKLIEDNWYDKIKTMHAELEEYGHISSAVTPTDKIVALLIEKIGTPLTLQLFQIIASRSVTDIDTFLGPDLFTDKPLPRVQWTDRPNEQQYAASLLLQRRPDRPIFPIEFRSALMTVAESLLSPDIRQDRPMNRIVIAFSDKEHELNMTFWQDKETS